MPATSTPEHAITSITFEHILEIFFQLCYVGCVGGSRPWGHYASVDIYHALLTPWTSANFPWTFLPACYPIFSTFFTTFFFTFWVGRVELNGLVSYLGERRSKDLAVIRAFGAERGEEVY